MNAVPRGNETRNYDNISTRPNWSLNSKLYVGQKGHVETEYENIITDNIEYDTRHSDEEVENPLTSVSVAKRQNALLKQRELERIKNDVNDINSRLRVIDHGHYEQWARSPVKRSNTSVLYRGIQQLRARMMKEESDIASDKKVSFSDSNSSRDDLKHSAQSSVYSERFSKDYNKHSALSTSQPHSSILRRQRGVESGIARFSANSRSPLKVPNAVVHVLSERLEKPETDVLFDRKSGSSRLREQIKFRFGATKARDRFPLPLSVNAPTCIEDPLFLVNEPIRSSDIHKQKSKLDLKEIDSKPQKFDYRLKTMDGKAEINNSAGVSELRDRVKTSNQPFERTKSYFGSFAPRKLLATIRVAELYDFSQMTQYKQPTELRYLERQLTDPTIMMRGSRVIKWAPHLQRMNEKN